MPRNKNGTWTVTVTEDIITESIRGNSSHCMIAEAVKQQIDGATMINVDLATIRFSIGEWRYIVLTPQIGQISLVQFDQGEHVNPFRLTLKPAQKLPRQRHTKPEVKNVRKTIKERPIIIGGTPPPMGPLANVNYRGKRREFGLRILKP